MFFAHAFEHQHPCVHGHADGEHEPGDPGQGQGGPQWWFDRIGPSGDAKEKEPAGAVVCGARRRSLECMRFGNVEIRPLGGGLGCLLMVLFSVVASVVLTVLVNLLL